MTPKEKAEELYIKMENKIHIEPYTWEETCKECALIAVDEVKEQLTSNLDNEVSAIHAIYWEKVKQEIEKL